MSLQNDMKEKRKQPDLNICDKQDIANQITDLIQSINIIIRKNNVTTFDLKDIRELIENQSADWEIKKFKNIFEQIWTSWRE